MKSVFLGISLKACNFIIKDCSDLYSNEICTICKVEARELRNYAKNKEDIKMNFKVAF